MKVRWGYFEGVGLKRGSRTIAILTCCSLLNSCGYALPAMDVLHPDKKNFVLKTNFNDFIQIIANHVRCELREAVMTELPNRAPLKKWAAKIALTIRAVDKGQANPSVMISNIPGTFNVGLGAQLEADATREMTMTYFITFDELIAQAEAIDKHHGSRECDHGDGTPITGNLGIDSTMAAALESFDSVYTKRKDGPFDTITHHVLFTIQAGGTASPTWKLDRVSISGSPLLGATRTQTNELLLTMGPTQVPENQRVKQPVPAVNESFEIERIRSRLLSQ